MPPAISIVIPLHNKRDYIERCLRSVRAQTFVDYQIVIVNDGSTDGCEKLAEPFLRDGDLLINQANGGHAAARNRGLAAALAPVAASLDADDVWLPEHLACIHELSRRFPEAGLLSTGTRELSGRRAVDTCLFGTEPRIVSYFLNSIGAFPLNSSSVAIRRQAFEQSGGFILNEPVGADREYWARIALDWPLALYPRVTSVYYKDASGTALLRRGSKGRCGFHLIYGMLERALEDGRVSGAVAADVCAYAAALRLEHAWFLVRRGRFGEAGAVIANWSTPDRRTNRARQLLSFYIKLGRWFGDESYAGIALGTAAYSLVFGPRRLAGMLRHAPRRHQDLVIWDRTL